MKAVSVQFLGSSSFEAARALDFLPVENKSHGLHGHSFRISLLSEPIKDNQSLDYIENKERVDLLKTLTQKLDYLFLNEIIKNPCDENIARWIEKNINSSLQDTLKAVGIIVQILRVSNLYQENIFIYGSVFTLKQLTSYLMFTKVICVEECMAIVFRWCFF